jgi:hypothetical protein
VFREGRVNIGGAGTYGIEHALTGLRGGRIPPPLIPLEEGKDRQLEMGVASSRIAAPDR